MSKLNEKTFITPCPICLEKHKYDLMGNERSEIAEATQVGILGILALPLIITAAPIVFAGKAVYDLLSNKQSTKSDTDFNKNYSESNRTILVQCPTFGKNFEVHVRISGNNIEVDNGK